MMLWMFSVKLSSIELPQRFVVPATTAKCEYDLFTCAMERDQGCQRTCPWRSWGRSTSFPSSLHSSSTCRRSVRRWGQISCLLLIRHKCRQCCDPQAGPILTKSILKWSIFSFNIGFSYRPRQLSRPGSPSADDGAISHLKNTIKSCIAPQLISTFLAFVLFLVNISLGASEGRRASIRMNEVCSMANSANFRI